MIWEIINTRSKFTLFGDLFKLWGWDQIMVTKQTNKLRLYSTVHQKPEFELYPKFVTGLVDAEGCLL
jgi:hypothetical protein